MMLQLSELMRISRSIKKIIKKSGNDISEDLSEAKVAPTLDIKNLEILSIAIIENNKRINENLKALNEIAKIFNTISETFDTLKQKLDNLKLNNLISDKNFLYEKSVLYEKRLEEINKEIGKQKETLKKNMSEIWEIKSFYSIIEKSYYVYFRTRNDEMENLKNLIITEHKNLFENHQKYFQQVQQLFLFIEQNLLPLGYLDQNAPIKVKREIDNRFQLLFVFQQLHRIAFEHASFLIASLKNDENIFKSLQRSVNYFFRSMQACLIKPQDQKNLKFISVDGIVKIPENFVKLASNSEHFLSIIPQIIAGVEAVDLWLEHYCITLLNKKDCPKLDSNGIKEICNFILILYVKMLNYLKNEPGLKEKMDIVNKIDVIEIFRRNISHKKIWQEEITCNKNPLNRIKDEFNTVVDKLFYAKESNLNQIEDAFYLTIDSLQSYFIELKYKRQELDVENLEACIKIAILLVRFYIAYPLSDNMRSSIETLLDAVFSKYKLWIKSGNKIDSDLERRALQYYELRQTVTKKYSSPKEIDYAIRSLQLRLVKQKEDFKFTESKKILDSKLYNDSIKCSMLKFITYLIPQTINQSTNVVDFENYQTELNNFFTTYIKDIETLPIFERFVRMYCWLATVDKYFASVFDQKKYIPYQNAINYYKLRKLVFEDKAIIEFHRLKYNLTAALARIYNKIFEKEEYQIKMPTKQLQKKQNPTKNKGKPFIIKTNVKSTSKIPANTSSKSPKKQPEETKKSNKNLINTNEIFLKQNQNKLEQFYKNVTELFNEFWDSYEKKPFIEKAKNCQKEVTDQIRLLKKKLEEDLVEDRIKTITFMENSYEKVKSYIDKICDFAERCRSAKNKIENFKKTREKINQDFLEKKTNTKWLNETIKRVNQIYSELIKIQSSTKNMGDFLRQSTILTCEQFKEKIEPIHSNKNNRKKTPNKAAINKKSSYQLWHDEIKAEIKSLENMQLKLNNTMVKKVYIIPRIPKKLLNKSPNQDLSETKNREQIISNDLIKDELLIATSIEPPVDKENIKNDFIKLINSKAPVKDVNHEQKNKNENSFEEQNGFNPDHIIENIRESFEEIQKNEDRTSCEACLNNLTRFLYDEVNYTLTEEQKESVNKLVDQFTQLLWRLYPIMNENTSVNYYYIEFLLTHDESDENEPKITENKTTLEDCSNEDKVKLSKQDKIKFRDINAFINRSELRPDIIEYVFVRPMINQIRFVHDSQQENSSGNILLIPPYLLDLFFQALTKILCYKNYQAITVYLNYFSGLLGFFKDNNLLKILNLAKNKYDNKEIQTTISSIYNFVSCLVTGILNLYDKVIKDEYILYKSEFNFFIDKIYTFVSQLTGIANAYKCEQIKSIYELQCTIKDELLYIKRYKKELWQNLSFAISQSEIVSKIGFLKNREVDFPPLNPKKQNLQSENIEKDEKIPKTQKMDK